MFLRRPSLRLLALTVALGLPLLLLGYTRLAARTLSGTPPAMAGAAAQADRILVEKSARRLTLLRQGVVLAQYQIALGGAPEGRKTREGDERTPEGIYHLDWRNPNSVAYLSLHISYPDAADRAAAEAGGVDPGGNIMIHGLPNGWGFLGAVHRRFDWTDGCIGVTNEEMRDIWSRSPNGTEIEIRA
ncbi:L,D-transpeptidase family protein [Phaeovulum sp. W22_SRMD_FR3]|uniref:L,D-transpeptidase family protein n=1 Tax=Phaeovulum sp. W22_SRMD_FR3 TaxID=3240274 RepID=UPI003F9B2A27